MLRVGIVGCGKIADSHASQILRIGASEIVGVCDPEPLMAQQLSERFAVKACFTDLDELLHTARPDVVHITSPPHTHLAIGHKCLEYGTHILVEKPFTINTRDARALIDAANHARRKLTVGHDAQFSIVAREMRHLVQQGYLGGPPVHMESTWCYDLSDPTYAKALLDDRHHWARQLPGGLPHNIINHGVSKIAEFMESDTPQVLAHGFVSPFLRRLGNTELVDELRVILHEERGTTAYFTFSTQMRPSLHQFSVFGHENGITIDEDRRTLIKLRGTSYKSHAEHFLQPISYAKQYVRNSFRNVRQFVKNEAHMDDGKYRLFRSFYESILNGTPVPIPYREILLTSYIMDEVFAQVSPVSSRRRGEPALPAVTNDGRLV